MWINDKVTYTPEIVTVTEGKPIPVTIESVGMDGMFTVVLPDGGKHRVEARLCKPA